MRSTQDLITELDEASSEHWLVVIAVGFKDSSVFVRANVTGVPPALPGWQ